MNSPPLDLKGLAIDRQPPLQSQLPKAPVRWFSRYLFPLGLLAGFLGLLAFTVGEQLFPPASVTVTLPIVQESKHMPAGSPLFQAPGWIEPRPTMVNITALTGGTIEELLVVEGQQVSKGQVVAKLITADIELRIKQTQNLIAIRQGELNRAIALRDGLEQKYRTPVHLETNLAEAKSQLAKTETLRSQIPYLVQSLEAKVKYARQNWEGKQASTGTVAQRLIDQAEQEYLSLAADLAEMKQRGNYLDQEIEALKQKQQALQQQLDLRIDEASQYRQALAQVESAEAMLQEAKLQLEKTELDLSRTSIVAPADGRILRLLAAPGSDLSPGTLHGNATVAEMYDPLNLQVRADVRLEDVPKVYPGQIVEIRTASVVLPINGRVSHLTSAANVQRNTLEVKVQLLEPPETIKPEMLVTATFISAETPTAASDPANTQRSATFIPRHLVVNENGSTGVWIVNDQSRSVLQPVEIGTVQVNDLVEIVSGLNLTDKLISSPAERLANGQRVRISSVQ